MNLSLFKRILAAGLCLSIICGTSMTSNAAESNGYAASPRYTYISSYFLSLNVGDGNACITADLISKDKDAECYIKCNLEKLTGSTYWMQMKSFSSTGTGATVLSVNHDIDRGTYRVMGVFRCNTETQTGYTGNQTY